MWPDTTDAWGTEEIYREARRLTSWHYQWMMVHEFLPLFIGRTLVNDILSRGRRFYRPVGRLHAGRVPGRVLSLRSQHGAAFVSREPRRRQRRPVLRLHLRSVAGRRARSDDLRGGVRTPRRFVGWQTFFDFGDGKVRPNKRIDTTLSTPLFQLPRSAIAGEGGPIRFHSAICCGISRGSCRRAVDRAGDAGAGAVERRPRGIGALGANLDRSTPLWFYILREAHVIAQGRTLGPVGGRIVGEVLIGLMQLNRNSFLRANPRWRPTLPNRLGQQTDDFRMVDFLTFAGVAPAQRGQ